MSDSISQLDLELAASGALSDERVAEILAELERQGRSGELERLRAANAAFHERFDRDVMLRQIEHRFSREQANANTKRLQESSMTTPPRILPSVPSYAIVGVLACAAVGAAGLIASLDERGDEQPVAAPAPVEHSAELCDLTKQWPARDRRIYRGDGIVAYSRGYLSSMDACVSTSLGVIRQMDPAAHNLPPEELVYACDQDYAYACKELGRFYYHGPEPFITMRSSRRDFRDLGSRLEGAGHLERSCELDDLHGCCALANFLTGDSELAARFDGDAASFFSRADALQTRDEVCVRYAEPYEDEEVADVQWRWVGFEVVGQRGVGRGELVKGAPIELGEAPDEPLEELRAWGEERAKEHDLELLHVGVVRFGDGDAYLILNVVEREDAWRDDVRAAPEEDLSLDAPALVDVYTRYLELRQELFESGRYKEAREEVAVDALGAYLTYPEHEGLNAHAEKMREIAPAHHARLLELVEHASAQEERARAANLLNWAGSLDQSILHASALLDDPSVLVRNDLARFMVHYASDLNAYVKQSEARRAIVEALMRMHARPSHADRNKSIYSLLYIAKSNPELRAMIAQHELFEFIEMTASQSVLSNVGEPARELSSLLEERRLP